MTKEETEKEVIKEVVCQLCNLPPSEGTWNPYFNAHKECLNGQGRIGT